MGTMLVRSDETGENLILITAVSTDCFPQVTSGSSSLVRDRSVGQGRHESVDELSSSVPPSKPERIPRYPDPQRRSRQPTSDTSPVRRPVTPRIRRGIISSLISPSFFVPPRRAFQAGGECDSAAFVDRRLKVVGDAHGDALGAGFDRIIQHARYLRVGVKNRALDQMPEGNLGTAPPHRLREAPDSIAFIAHNKPRTPMALAGEGATSAPTFHESLTIAE